MDTSALRRLFAARPVPGPLAWGPGRLVCPAMFLLWAAGVSEAEGLAAEAARRQAEALGGWLRKGERA